MMVGVTDIQSTSEVQNAAAKVAGVDAARVLVLVVVFFVVGGLLGWVGVREIRKERGALRMMREAVEGSLAPGEVVTVDDRLLGWALRRDGALRQSVWTVSEDVPVSSLLAQMEASHRREMVVVARPDDGLIQHLDAAGFSVAQEVGWVPWDLKGNGWGLLGRGKMRIFFAVAPKAVAPKNSVPATIRVTGRYHRSRSDGRVAMRRALGCVVLAVAAVGMAAGQFSNPANDVPAYNSAAPKGALPPLLHGEQLTGPNFAHGYQVIAYKMAAKVPGVLYQEPCYCHCDRAMGHTSLHSCFEVTHGAECSTCMKEGVYAYRETMRGQSPAQIRAGIERGEFAKVDLDTITLPK